VVNIDEQDIEEALADVLERYATYEPVGDDEKAQDGDQVIIDFKGTIDGEEFSGGSAENYPYILGSGRFFPEFEKALKGAQVGKKKKPKVTFPEDYFAEEVRGKEAQFTITINEIKRKKLPELTDDFAKELGFESAVDMRAKTEENLREHSENRSRQIAESRALDAVVEASTYEIPASLIASVSQEQRNLRIQQLIQARISPERMREMTENLEAESREAAIQNIKRLVALNEIAEAEGVEITDEDFEKEAAAMAKSVGAEVELVAQYLAQGEQRGATLDRIYRAKTLAVIMDNAKVTDKVLTREEMEQAEAAEGEE
jgi:trigger factor